MVSNRNDDIMRAIGRLEGKVDSLIADAKSDDIAHNGHEKRIAALEKKQYGIFLVGGIMGTLFLAAIRYVGKFFGGD